MTKTDSDHLLDELPDGVAAFEIILDDAGRPSDYRFLEVNPTFERLTGLTRNEVIGKSVRNVLPQTEAWWFDKYDEVSLSGQPTRFETHTKDLARYFEVRVFRTQARQLATMLTDITGRQQAEEALRKSERSYRTLVASMSEGLVVQDKNGILTFLNKRACEVLGYELDDLIGKPTSMLFDEENQRIYLDQMLQRRKGVHKKYEMAWRRKDGTNIPTIISPTALFDDKGNFEGSVAVFTDIAERKRAEETLDRERIMLRTLIDHLPDAIYVKDRQTRKTVANLADIHNIGLRSESDVLGKSDFDLFPKDVAEAFYADDLAVLQTGEPVINREERFPGENGQNRWLLTTKVPVRDKEGQIIGLVGIGHDITSHRRAEESLRLFRALLDQSNDAIEVIDPATGRLIDMNERGLHDLGYTREDLASLTIVDIDSTFSDSVFAGIAAELREKGSVIWEGNHRRKDGSTFPVEVSMKFARLERDYIVTSVRNITDRKRMEEALREAAREMQQAKEAAEAATRSKSEFLANMSHEIRTPMNAVIGMTGILLDSGLNDEQREYVEIVRTSGDALLTIINDILDFSKIESGMLELEQVPFPLTTCIEESLDLLSSKAGEKGIELAYMVDGNTPQCIVGDVTRLRQILANLLSNAVKFTAAGEIVISVTNRAVEGNIHELKFAVQDTGIGIPSKHLDRLFKSFSQVDSSTTRMFGGTGLGLAISKRLSELMGGTMWVESREGVGSTFFFTIVAPSAPATLREHTRGEQPQLRGKRLLIVDDNQTNRRILTMQARSWEMMPEEAASGEEALEMLQQSGPFDLAILDMQMPGMDGAMLSNEIRQRSGSRSLPLVMLTSVSTSARQIREKHGDLGLSAFLTKPIKPSQLYDVLIGVFSNADACRSVAAVRAKPDPAIAARLPLRILLAEDNMINQKVALLMLARIGCRADVAGNGAEAVEAIRRQPYDLIFMDVHMPEMDGFEATAKIRAIEGNDRHTNIIAMTANALDGDRELCLEAGMDDYISKPVRQNDLAAAINRRLPHIQVTAADTAKELPVQQLIDESVLRELRDLGGTSDPEFIGQLFRTFVQEAPQQIEQIGSALRAGDLNLVRETSHMLKGACTQLGLAPLAGICRRLEDCGQSRELNGSAESYAELQKVFRQTKELLLSNHILNGMNPSASPR